MISFHLTHAQVLGVLAWSSWLMFAGHLVAAEPGVEKEWSQATAIPDSLGVAGAFAGISENGLLVAGGANFPHGLPWEGGKKEWHDKVFFLPSPRGEWQTIGKLPRPLAYGVSLTTARGVVCVGGSDAERHYSSVIRLTWRQGKLRVEEMPALPRPLALAAGALVNDTIYIACGAEQPGEEAASNRLFMLDLAREPLAWREAEALPGKPRLLPVAAGGEGEFYLLGGAALVAGREGKMTRDYLREAWSYLAGRGWKRLADLPQPVVAAASPAPMVNGKIWLLAGDDGSRVGFQPVAKHPGFPGTVFCYDPRQNSWSATGTTPAPRATLPCVAWRGQFVFPSGEVRPGVRSPEVWLWNPPNR